MLMKTEARNARPRGVFHGEETTLLTGDSLLAPVLPEALAPTGRAMFGEGAPALIGEPAPSPRQLRTAYAQFPSGVVAVCAMVKGKPVGMIMSSFTSVSLDPPLVSVCVDHGSSTWPILQDCTRLGVTVLAQDHEAICRQLAARGSDRFKGLTIETTDTGAVFLPGGSLWLECVIHMQVRAGDHDVIFLEPRVIRAEPGIAPLLFHGSKFKKLETPADN